MRNGRWGRPEPSGPAENRCPSHGPGSTIAGRPGHLFQVTSSSDKTPSPSVTPSPSGTTFPRQSCIRLPPHHLKTRPWALAPLALLQGTAGCRGAGEGRGAAGRHRQTWQTLPMLWSRAGIPAPQGQDPAPCSPSSPLRRAAREPWGLISRPGCTCHCRASATTTSPPRAQPGHKLFHPQQPGKVPAAPSVPGSPWAPRAPGRELAEEPPSPREHPGGRREAPRRPGITGCRRRIRVAWEGWGAHPGMSPAPPSPALSPPGLTQGKTDPDEPHRGLSPGARRCQRCGQRGPGGGCLGRTGSGSPQDRHLPRAAGQPDPQETTAQPCCALPGDS